MRSPSFCLFVPALLTFPSDLLRLGPVVSIRVGNSSNGREETFWVHERLICYYSPFFDAACHGEWTESSNKAIELPEDDPDIFALFVQRLYSGDCAYAYPGSQEIDFEKLVALYAFADKVRMLLLKDEVVDKIIDRIVGGWFSIFVYQVRLVYENTTEDSGLRKMICYVVLDNLHRYPKNDIAFLWEGGHKIGREFAAEYPDFFYDLTLHRSNDHNFNIKCRNCLFHDHVRDSFCTYRQRRRGY